MSRSPDETYVQTYQKYLKQKDTSDDLRRAISSHTASAKVIRPPPKVKECKICSVLLKPGDVCKILNQGLFHKYTSSQDYFYTKDINALLNKKRKTFCIKYYDDMAYDECRERLKAYFRKPEAASLMGEIKDFYTKFRNFPRNFHTNFYHIINSNIRKHRRLEYIKVFNNVDFDEDKIPDEKDLGDPLKTPKDDCFNFMEMLGDSFLRDNYKDMSGIVIGDLKLDKRRDTEVSLREIEKNFKALYQAPKKFEDDPDGLFSNALYNKNYMLYSRRDSENAGDMLKEIITECRDVNLNQKASMTLADKVLQQVSSKNSKKLENRTSPKLKQRSGGDFSPVLQASKRSTGSSNVTVTLSQYQKPQSQVSKTGQRGGSNMRNSSQTEADNTSVLSKVNQSRLVEQRKSNTKFSVENLNDIAIDRNKILSKLYQFRSTRSKSGGLKSVSVTNKSSIAKSRRPAGLQCDTDSHGLDTTDLRQIQTAYSTNYKSQSPSLERKKPKEDTTDRIITQVDLTQSKHAGDSPYHGNTLKRSTSQGQGLGLKEVTSPTINQAMKPVHKKSNSMTKRSAATPKRHISNPSMQNFMTNPNNNSISNSNVSQSNQENPSSPLIKFISPHRHTPSAAVQGGYYLRHQSPLEDRRGQLTANRENKVKDINMRAVKNSSPKRVDTSNGRTGGTLSMSGRYQNMLDLSQGASSFLGNQTTVQTSKATANALKRKKLMRTETQVYASKANKSSIAHNRMNSPGDEIIDREKRGKKALELSSTNYSSYKDLKLQSKEQTPSNYCPSSTTSLNKFKVEVKKNSQGIYTVKGSSKDLRFTLKK